ncbi:uncharacterized protein LOC143148348 isoform X4 [Ptiloglossa arizonensis]|uniref:uncharacterized protein LOC143148348 isoform X4 n=1 Tax=Ptiloglossa arizonensis TaxID=3350558 RepID=UPI003FA01447
MLRDGEVPEGRAEAAVVQKVAHRVGHGTLEPLQGAANLVDGLHRHRKRTIRIADQSGGNRGGGGQRLRERRSDPDATVEPRLGSRSFQLQSLVEREFDARRAQPQPSWNGWQERHRQGYHQQRAGCRKTDLRHSERLPRGGRHATRTRRDHCSCEHRGQQAPREEPRAQSSRHEAQDTQMPISGMQEGLHQELASEGPSEDAHGREAVQVQLGRLRVAIRALRRADAPLSQAHRRETVQVPALRPMLLAQRSPSPPHEETRVIDRPRERSSTRVAVQEGRARLHPDPRVPPERSPRDRVSSTDTNPPDDEATHPRATRRW